MIISNSELDFIAIKSWYMIGTRYINVQQIKDNLLNDNLVWLANGQTEIKYLSIASYEEEANKKFL